MSYYMAPLDYDVSSFGSYALYMDVQVGSNGDTGGDPTYDVGDDQGEEAWAYKQWDSNLSDGFDTGDINVQFTGDSSGQESMAVGSDAPIAYSGDSSGAISSVVFQAGVMIPAEAKFSDITVQFWSGTTLRETVSFASGPDANTMNTPATPQAEQILTVTPTFSDCNKVRISATERLRAPAGTFPSSTNMFCDVFVYGGGTA
jgi:hypothetical protein